MRNSLVLISALAALALSGCATKTFVEERVSGLEARLDEHDARIAELSQTSREALARAEDAGVLARGKFLYTVVLTEEGVRFESEEAKLSPDAADRLNRLASELRAENRNVYLEIQGHTDATGSPEYNQWLGQQRADAVRRQLHRQGVALERMATISYGEDAPTADNSTPEGRAQNRRVEIVVLE